jgi:hypothetical protein
MIMIARNYGIWNMLIYTPLIGIIILLIYAGAGGGLLLAVVIPILGIYYLIINIIKNFVDKTPPVNNSRSNNNRSNNTRTSTAKYLN